MGMYDEIICYYPLDNCPDWCQRIFQTKDLECLMNVYQITENGDLYRVVYRGGEIDAAITPERKVNYHGDIEMGVCNIVAWHPETGHKLRAGTGTKRAYLSYTVRFTNGKVERITEDHIFAELE